MNGEPRPLRFGIIGLGRMGQNHLRVLSMLGGAEVGFLYDADVDKARGLAEGFGRLLLLVQLVVRVAPLEVRVGVLRVEAGGLSKGR